MKLKNAAAAARLATAVSTPGNGQYGKFLTAKQWEAQFSPSAADVAKVSAYLRQNGFKVLGASADRLVIRASGTVSQIERVFSTSLATYNVAGHIRRLAERNFSVPNSIASAVLGFPGITQTVARPASTTGAAKPNDPPPPPGSFDPPPGFRVAQPCGAFYSDKVDTALPPYGNGYPPNPFWAVCGYKPPQFRSAYNLSGPDDGTGVTVGIVDAYAAPTIVSDAQTYASINDPANPFVASKFSQHNAGTYTDAATCGPNGWFGEETLDVEAVHSTAPGANIVYAGAQNCFTWALNNAVRTIVDGHLANVITNSYGDPAGDVLDPPAERQSTDEILQMAAATGISVMFSSGDNGDEFTSFGEAVADYPASSPWASAIGGTTLKIDAAGQSDGQYGWSTARSFLCNETYIVLGGCTAADEGKWLPFDPALDGGSGGGTSVSYKQPAYQVGVVPLSLSTAQKAVVGNDPTRVVPDISMEADPATGMLVGETQTFPDGVYYDQYRIGGTSVSSPLFAGVVARAIQTAGHGFGLLNPALYKMYGDSSSIYDVLPAGKVDQSRADFANSISPSNGFLFSTRLIDYEGPESFCPNDVPCTTRNVAIPTAKGYDAMTGIGTPTGNFVNSLAAGG
jgi:subtilase family serine protease